MIPLLAAALLAAAPGAAVEPGEVEAAPPDASPPSDGAPPLAFRGHLEWISAVGSASSRASPANPENRVLELPAFIALSELRPDLRLEVGPRLTAVIRPRLLLQVTDAKSAGRWLAETSDARAEWIEAYATVTR